MLDNLMPVVLGYGVGSLPLGYVLARRLRGVDLTRTGSGNVGATNVYRATGLGFALLVMAIDMTKGATSVVMASRLDGGGAAATAAGAFAVLAPLATALASIAFVAAIILTRYVSLGSMVATATLPALAWVTGAPLPAVVGGTLAAAVIIERHRGNLRRLQAGTERRLGQ